MRKKGSQGQPAKLQWEPAAPAQSVGALRTVQTPCASRSGQLWPPLKVPCLGGGPKRRSRKQGAAALMLLLWAVLARAQVLRLPMLQLLEL